jgi:undecaprenyl pyrophosphate phosphatase UppP
VAVWFLLGYLRRHDLKLFVFYRFALGAAILLVIGLGARSATGL